MLEEFEAALSRVGGGRPPGATEEVIDEFIREADIYEAEFVMPVSAAELAEQQEAAAAAAAAAAAEKAAEGGEGDEGDDGDGPAAAPVEVKLPPSNKKGKKGGSSISSKKGKSGGSKKGTKKGAAAEDDDANPDASAHRGPLVTLFSGATRVRKAGHAKQEQQQVKQEDGGNAADGAVGDSMQADSAAVKQEDGTAGVAPVKQEEDITKMVSPLEELDDSGRGVFGGRLGCWHTAGWLVLSIIHCGGLTPPGVCKTEEHQQPGVLQCTNSR